MSNGHGIKVTLAREGEIYKLTVERTGDAYTSDELKDLNVQFESSGSDGANCQATATEWKVDGVSKGAPSSTTQINMEETDLGFKVLEITFTVKDKPSEGDPAFKIKLHRGFLGDNVKILCTDNGSSLNISCYDGTFPAGFESVNGGTTPGTGGNGNGSGGGRKVVYHLNPPTGSVDDVEGKAFHTDEGVDGTFTLQNIGWGYDENAKTGNTLFNGFDEATDKNLLEKLYQGQYTDGYFFAGWDTAAKPVNTSYADIDFPVCNFSGNSRGFNSNTALGGTVTDLYAVWTTKPGLFGYTMAGGIDAGAAVEAGATLYDTGKYVVYDEGHEKGKGYFLVTNAVPVRNDDYKFIAWFNKNPYNKTVTGATNNNYVVLGGDTVTYGGENNIYSLDTVWGLVSGGDRAEQLYDGAFHGIDMDKVVTGFQGGTYNKDAQKAAFSGAFDPKNVVYTFSSVTKDGEPVTLPSAANETVGYTSGTNAAGTRYDNMPTFKEPGEYVYEIKATLMVPSQYTDNTTASSAGIKVGTTHATLTITDEAMVVYHLNDGTEEKPDNGKWVEDKKTAAEKTGDKYVFTLKNVEEAFTKPELLAESNYKNLGEGEIQIGDGTDKTTVYFLGWSENKDAKAITDVEYKALNISKTQRHLLDGQKITMDKPGVKHLYAIWSEAGALFGYTMTIPTGDFTSIPAGFAPNGTTSISGSNKYVDVTREYDYDYDAPKSPAMTIAVTGNKPVDNNAEPDEHYTFVTWYNKNYNRPDPDKKVRALNGGNPGNAGIPFIAPGGTVYFGETHTIFSLDAVWARVTGGEKRAFYSNADIEPGDVKLHVVGGEDITPEAFNTLHPTYTVTVSKDGTQIDAQGPTDLEAVADHHTEQTKTTIGCLDIPLELPAYREVGAYTYDIAVDLDGVEVKGTYTLVIDPLVQVSVTKVLEGRDWKADDSFTFELSAPGHAAVADTLTVACSTDQHKALSGSFALEAGTYDLHVKETPGTEAGMTYDTERTITVKVDDTKPYSVNVAGTPKSGNVIEVPFTFTNTYGTGTLVLTKHITHESAHSVENPFKDESRFKFTIMSDPALTGKYGDLEFSGGSATYEMIFDNLPSIAENETKKVEFPGLPAGVTYTISEEENENYATDIDQPVVHMTKGARAEVTVTNAHNPGSLTISKTVSDPYLNTHGTPEKKQFKFKVSLYSDTDKMNLAAGAKGTLVIGGVSSELAFADGTETIVLENGQTAVINSLDTNTVKAYKVEETQFAAPGVAASAASGWTAVEDSYTTTANGASGTTAEGEISGAGSANAAFVNTFKTGSLSIKKAVSGTSDTAIPFPMELTLSGPVYEELQGQFTKERLEAACQSSGISAVAAVDATQATIDFALRHGQTLTLSDLPAGVAFSVSETTENRDGFSTVYELNGAGTNFDNTVIEYNNLQAVTVSNTYQSAALTVSKEVAEGGSQARAFSVRIQLKGSDYTPVTLDRSYPVTYGLTSTFRRVAAPTSVRFNDGVGTLTLYHGENAVISGLPKGVIIAITEPGTADDGYTAAYRKAGVSEATCEFALNSDTSVAVVNTYSAGSLTVTKNVTGTAGDQNTAFNFTVKLSDETVTGPRGSGVTFEKGSASFSLKHGEKKTILGLPAGVTYTVTETEANQDGYTTTYKVNDGTETDEPATGTIAKDAVAAVTVTNHKDTPAGPGPGNGGGTVDPPIDEEPDPSPSPSPSPSASPEPSASPAPTLEPGTTSEPFGTPAPTRQPGTTSQPYGTPTPGGNGSGGPTSPATGDGTVIEPWAALLGLSLMGLAAVIVRRKRRQRG